jgi:hypothetical protein
MMVGEGGFNPTFYCQNLNKLCFFYFYKGKKGYIYVYILSKILNILGSHNIWGFKQIFNSTTCL